MCLLNKFSFYLRQDAMLQSLYFQCDDWFQITLKNGSVLCVTFIVMLLSYLHI